LNALFIQFRGYVVQQEGGIALPAGAAVKCDDLHAKLLSWCQRWLFTIAIDGVQFGG
jgi:hypothetical protein